MRVNIEEVPGVDEVIAHYLFPVHNLHPAAVRKSLKRAVRRADDGPDLGVLVIMALKDDAEILPEIEAASRKSVIEAYSLGGVINGHLEIIDPYATEAQAEEGDDCTLLVPLVAVESMTACYCRWEPKR